MSGSSSVPPSEAREAPREATFDLRAATEFRRQQIPQIRLMQQAGIAAFGAAGPALAVGFALAIFGALLTLWAVDNPGSRDVLDPLSVVVDLASAYCDFLALKDPQTYSTPGAVPVAGITMGLDFATFVNDVAY